MYLDKISEVKDDLIGLTSLSVPYRTPNKNIGKMTQTLRGKTSSSVPYKTPNRNIGRITQALHAYTKYLKNDFIG